MPPDPSPQITQTSPVKENAVETPTPAPAEPKEVDLRSVKWWVVALRLWWIGVACLAFGSAVGIWRYATVEFELRVGYIILALAVGFIVILWKVPEHQSLAFEQREKFDVANESRKTIAQIVGGLLLLAGLYATAKQVNSLQEQLKLSAQTFKIAQEQVRIAQEGQLTDRFGKAVEQLGNSASAVRLGGIYALARLGSDSMRDHSAVVEVLTAYVRQHAPWHVTIAAPASLHRYETTPPLSHEYVVEIQAIILLLSSDKEQKAIDLSHANLSKINFEKLFFREVNFNNSNFEGASCAHAHFNGSNFYGADLGADFDSADLSDARLDEADMRGSLLGNAGLSGATFNSTDLRGVDLTRAYGIKQNSLKNAKTDERAKLPQ
jgi:hypothetical protein